MKNLFILLGVFMAIMTASMMISFAADGMNRGMNDASRGMMGQPNWNADSQQASAHADAQERMNGDDRNREINNRWNGEDRMNWNGNGMNRDNGHYNERQADRDRNEGMMRHIPPYSRGYNSAYPYSYSYGSPYYGNSAYSYPYYTAAYAYPYSTYNAYPLSTYSYNSGYSGTGLAYNNWYY